MDEITTTTETTASIKAKINELLALQRRRTLTPFEKKLLSNSLAKMAERTKRDPARNTRAWAHTPLDRINRWGTVLNGEIIE